MLPDQINKIICPVLLCPFFIKSLLVRTIVPKTIKNEIKKEKKEENEHYTAISHNKMFQKYVTEQ